MAIINPTVKRALQGAQSLMSAAWTLGDADTAIEVSFPDYADKSVQVEGTFGAATVVLEGSNDGTNWHTLRDPTGAALSFTTAGLKAVMETTLHVRPKSTGGTASSVTVTLLGRMGQPRAWS